MGLFYGWEIAIAKKYVRQFRSTCQCLERDFEDDLVDECLKHWYFLKDTVSRKQKKNAGLTWWRLSKINFPILSRAYFKKA